MSTSHCDVDAIRARLGAPLVEVEIAGQSFAVQQVSYRDLARYLARRSHPVAPVRYFGLRRLLRAAFGWKWSYLWSRGADPVELLMARSAETRGRVVAALLKQSNGTEFNLEMPA